MLSFAAGFWPSTALAQEQPAVTGLFPTRYTQRSLTLPALHLRVEPQLGLWVSTESSENNVLVLLNGGLGFGVIDDLELGLGSSPIAPLMGAAGFVGGRAGLGGALTPEPVRGSLSPTLYARYRLGALPRFEAGLEVAVALPANGRDAAIIFGLPLRVRGGDHFALDASVAGWIEWGHHDVYGVLLVTLMPRFALDNFYVGLNTGVVLPIDAPEYSLIGLHLEVGGTTRAGVAVLDTYVRFGFPYFMEPGAEGDRVVTDPWELTFGVRAHIGMGRK